MIHLAVAATFLWLGMVLAISFLEAPLKFRAPGVEIAVGLAIGRIVFRALNLVEVVWAAIILVTLIIGHLPDAATAAAIAGMAVLALQLGIVRPRLNRRSARVLAGENLPRSTSHHAYIALELVKVLALIVLGIALLSD